MKNKKIAIIGSGISGLGFGLIAQHNNLDITLFEKDKYFGGHSNTIDINIDNRTLPVDTGFLVHNKITYPNLIQVFDLLNVDIVDSDMSLSIKIENEKIEWGGTNLNTVFGQRRNLFKPKFYSFLLEILKFNKSAQEHLKWANENKDRTLYDLLADHGYSHKLRDWYIVPMAAAIWSTPADKILDFPAYTFLTFSLNHHLLQVNDRPVWRTVKNGTRNYVKKITDRIEKKFLNTAITSVEFQSNQVVVEFENKKEIFDYVIFATHADQTIKLIKNPTATQTSILKNFKYESNTAIVHSDKSFLPEREFLWSAWNYTSSPNAKKVSVSYLINKLQPLETSTPIIVTLNPHKEIDPQLIYRTIEYAHPLFDKNAIEAQAKITTIQGENNMFFAGAWGGYGFHEDGLKSAIKIAQILDLEIPWQAVI